MILTPSLFLVAGLIGLTVFSYYAKLRCDPLLSGMIDSPNKVNLCHYIHTASTYVLTLSSSFLYLCQSGASVKQLLIPLPIRCFCQVASYTFANQVLLSSSFLYHYQQGVCVKQLLIPVPTICFCQVAYYAITNKVPLSCSFSYSLRHISIFLLVYCSIMTTSKSIARYCPFSRKFDILNFSKIVLAYVTQSPGPKL